MSKNHFHSDNAAIRLKAGDQPPFSSKPGHNDGNRIDHRRYRRIRWFFLRVLLQLFWWDVIFTAAILRWMRPSPLERWQRLAGEYRELASNMGGILIKLGQFLSTRVHILPAVVTGELAGLQDDVKPDSVEAIVGVIEAEFGRPVTTLFHRFHAEPLGSASLAQAHAAELPSGDTVVMKVLRPDIDRIVATDLSAARLICNWLKFFRRIRERVDLDRLIEEFSTTTLKELDLVLEGENIRRFERDFKNNPHVYVPAVYDQFCTTRILTLENVGYFKISDNERVEAAGISRAKVAELLYDIYMHQIFVSNFVHVDPHPGNLFVRPLPTDQEIEEGTTEFGPGQSVPYQEARPFQLVLIDFGMTAEITERLKAAMRMGAIGLGTQDARKIIQAYVLAGALQPGADLRRLEEANQEWLQKVWGLRLGKLQETARRELRYFMREYRDLILETPFQVQADMLFIGRAVGILAGLTSTIDPEFDPWSKTLVYARRFAQEELTEDWQGFWQELFMLSKNVWRIPSHLEQVLTRTKQGALTVQVSLSPQMRKAVRRIDLSVRRFAWMVIAAGLLVSGVNLHIAGKDWPLGIPMIALSLVAFLWGMRRG